LIFVCISRRGSQINKYYIIIIIIVIIIIISIFSHLLFADDMKRFCATNSAEDCICLQSGIELVRGWCAAYFMTVNMGKTKVITAKRGLLQLN
jgi:uncharacterized protein YpmB